MADTSHTHHVDIDAHTGLVTKRYRATDRDEPAREWRALRLLAEYAPGLAPLPVRADLSAAPPEVVMTRIPGTPLRGRRIDAAQGAALAAAVHELHTALPAPVLDRVPTAAWHPAGAVAQTRQWCEAPPPPLGGTAQASLAVYTAGVRWLRSTRLSNDGPGHHPVFGMSDGNLTNYLYDHDPSSAQSRVRLVDFETSGRSDRVFELAELTEHISTWVDTDFDVRRDFLAHLDLSPAEATRLRECRRLIALIWLHVLLHSEGANRRNPPGSDRRQAERLMALLS
ncbi:phosphotransferase [Streptomyces boninensis]|uniref:phosphotransferase n=1 Tax=Streptomyces boninensis TaxID=2039455 RepID=UPI003B20CCEC